MGCKLTYSLHFKTISGQYILPLFLNIIFKLFFHLLRCNLRSFEVQEEIVDQFSPKLFQR